MNGRERFLTALTGGVPDRVPIFDFLDSPSFIERVIGRRPEQYLAEDILECTLAYGFDAAFLGYGGFGGYDPTAGNTLAEDCYRDEWGTVYKKSKVSWPMDSPIDFPIKDSNDLRRYRPPDPYRPERMEQIHLAQAMAGHRAAIVGGIQGPLTTGILLCGLETIFAKIVEEPAFVEEVFRLSNEYFVVAVQRMIADDVDAICVAEDLGSTQGPFMSRRHFCQLLRPFLKELFDETLRLDTPCFLHSCGNIMAILDDVISLGMNGLHPMQRGAGMSIKEVRARCGNRLCLLGNVDSSHALVYGSDNEIVRQTLEVIHDGATCGAAVLASDSDIRDEMPYEKVDLMFQCGLQYGKYPIDIEAVNARMQVCQTTAHACSEAAVPFRS